MSELNKENKGLEWLDDITPPIPINCKCKYIDIPTPPLTIGDVEDYVRWWVTQHLGYPNVSAVTVREMAHLLYNGTLLELTVQK